MKILITGATGFVGKTLVPYLYLHGITEIALLVRSKEKAETLFPGLLLTLIETGKEEWREEVIRYNADVVLHLAALFKTQWDAANAREIIETNILFTTLLLEAVTHTGCAHFINVGTFTEYLYGAGKYFSNSLYAATKTAVRPIIQFYQTQAHFDWINVVVYSSYGRKNEKKKVIDYMLDAMDATVSVNFSLGEQILDFIHVDDMADFFYVLLQKRSELKASYMEFHLGTGVGHSIREVGECIESVFDKKINANWGGLPYRPFDAMYAVAPIAKNIELLGWRARISLYEGLEILKNDLSFIDKK